uniref:Uncharacterized protein n=1 Tax=Kwoniella dejecticola CBS 10117 TaxID=1296121 RepID=A0A1A6ABV7_9TREE|nr:uncharacterized protein I303_01759 [Kwoniella dejecticola CBS 10117]OBR87551.1 hypothetical protein I303_01759 [Kwoniella dejecticola CBS 10117]
MTTDSPYLLYDGSRWSQYLDSAFHLDHPTVDQGPDAASQMSKTPSHQDKIGCSVETDISYESLADSLGSERGCHDFVTTVQANEGLEFRTVINTDPEVDETIFPQYCPYGIPRFSKSSVSTHSRASSASKGSRMSYIKESAQQSLASLVNKIAGHRFFRRVRD